MSFRTQLLLVPAALLLTASLGLAAPAAPGAPQPSPAATAAQPLAALSPAGPVCKGAANALVFSPEPQAAASETCGGCSDAACMGKTVNSVCGPDRRCLAGGPSCTALPTCRCLLIPD